MPFEMTLLWRSVPILLEGLTVTLLLSFLAISLSAMWAVIVLLALQGNRYIYAIGRLYVEIMRNTPIIVIMFFTFFGSGMLGWPMSGFAAGLLSLVLQNGAYVAEIYRGGIQGVSTRQTEAGLALGFMPKQTFLLIVLPQAIRKVIAPLGTQGVMIIKDTAIVATISVAEMTFQARLLADRTAAVFEIFIALAVLYIILTSIFNLGVRLLERKYGYKN
jgi:His/Glu/Gln/Arg/opine family amino acid ABC transporter permease subunit